MTELKQYWPRVLIGAVIGLLLCTLLAWLTQPGSLFGVPLGWDFTFCYNSNVPEALGAILGLLLWALFGAEVGIATIPFADDGRELVVRSLLHYAVTAATVSAWAVLNFSQEPLPWYLLDFLVPLTLVYLLVWVIRWIGWRWELDAIREKLGLPPRSSRRKRRNSERSDPS